MPERKIELRQHMIAHPISAEALKKGAKEIGLAPQTLKSYFYSESAPLRVCNKLIELGIPAHLAPIPTQTKPALIEQIRQLITRNEKLDSENKDLRSRLIECGCEFRETPKSTGV
ncbi:MAG TPA: hypothetical protein DCS48_07490 [Desulfovibrio sp.]|nr:hypothetical protein [Desulfovibrio sp.]